MNAKVMTMQMQVSPELYQMLDNLAEMAHSSRGDLVRKAFALIQVAIQTRIEGKKLVILDKNEKVVTEIVGI